MLDNNLSPRILRYLRSAGRDVAHSKITVCKPRRCGSQQMTVPAHDLLARAACAMRRDLLTGRRHAGPRLIARVDRTDTDT